ncbi:hypothetical protein GALMADRAFT_218749 [Galerina marginata CBS 339.88]|uniref:UBC core domain-containing protein n=1 Tax=Galerina marginata (strain CBS 339.88) TaxID=685588 RepID=A0A067U2M9_GALM3|nr:hypothetical protein GALMADRAFT_218749 [Galerina marginata CBS 339.88]
MRTRAKRPSSPTPIPEPTLKRQRKAVIKQKDVIVIDSDDENEDEEMKDILAQINAQEQSELLAKRLQHEYDGPSSSGPKYAPVNLEDDAAMARELAEQWAMEGNDPGIPMSLENLEPSDAIEFDLGPPSETRCQALEKGSRNNIGSHSISEGTKINESFSIKPDEALAPFKEVFTRTRNCSKCEKRVNSPRGCVMISEASFPPSMTHLLHAPCSSCRTNHCRGCFKTVTCASSCKGPSKNPKCTALNCCAEVRAIAVFETLGGFDRLFITERAASDTRALAISTKMKSKVSTVGPGGTGYGNGHGGSSHQSQNQRGKAKAEGSKSKQKKVGDHWDTVLLRTLNLLTELLPAPYTDDVQAYDILPHASLGYLISLSQIPTNLANLLRNDSVTDWTSRKDTYNAMLSFLRRMADCELTIQILIGQHWEQAATCGLEQWMWDEGDITWSTNSCGEVEASPALYSYFKKLTKQSETFLAGAMQMLGGNIDDIEVDEMVIQGTSLCGDIIAARDDLERAIAVLGQPESERQNRTVATNFSTDTHLAKKVNGKGKARDVSVDFDAVYAEACERLAFKHVALAEATSDAGPTYANYNYAQQLTQSQNSTRLPKDRLHLLKELAVTATSLPPGVWVVVDEVRNDAIKIMIAGPDGTPYAGGLFEFDCFMPIQYPAQPPLMHLRTTGGGSVRFNPNLYNNGKVCLSLLGTWPGRPEEQWSPKSTLLQVLVSIQSMILIDAPYYNEPGHGQANLKAPVSIDYNRNISLQTTRWAIVDWLDDKHRHGIWQDVIASHFIIRKDKIRQQIMEWSKKDPAVRAYTSTSYQEDYYHQGIQHPSTKKTAAKTGIDLLERFDKGIKVIESWNLTGDED